MRSPFTIILVFSTGLLASAQPDTRLFRTDAKYISDIKVTENNRDKPLAWCGGLDQPQFAMVDLDKDGMNDLVVFEGHDLIYYPYIPIVSNNIKTFLSVGTPGNPHFKYAPEYEYLVPYPYRMMKMLDYNCDSIPDFLYGNTILNICDGYYNSNNNWTCNNCRVIYDKGINPSPLVFAGGDIPGVADIDNDKDLDLVTANATNKFDLFRDMRNEDGLSCDSTRFKLKDQCWGKVHHPGTREFSFGVSCSNIGLKTSGDEAKTTDGSASVCLFDADGDGDFDALVSEPKYSDIQFLKNGKVEYGYPVDTMVAQDTIWQTGGHKLHMASYPMAHWLDIDNDNDRDIVIAPQTDENYRSVAYYSNNGNDAAPSFIYQSDTLLMQDMIDAGSNSYPCLYDYNKDGKMDLFIGGQVYQPGGLYKTSIIYLENTSTGNDVSFKVVTRNFLNIGSYAEKGAAISIGDLDGDGRDDLVAGREDGSIICFKNHASGPNAQPDWQLWQARMKTSDGIEMYIVKNAVPCIYDIDADGKNDLIVGNYTGYLTFYKNIGAGQISFEYKTDKLGNVKILPGQTSGFSAPYIGPVDNSGDVYLMVGSGMGNIYRYTGFQNGNVTGTYKMLDSVYSDVRVPGEYTSVAFGNVFGDHRYELFIGNVRGGVFAYRQVWDVNVDEVMKGSKMKIYPNPAKDRVTMTLEAELTSSVSIRLVDNMGRIVGAPHVVSGRSVELDVSMLPPGFYICLISTGKEELKGIFVKE